MQELQQPIRWTDDQTQLWRRIESHPFEDAALALDFTARLAREQDWTRDEVRAAIREYRRFCFLALAAGHEVTPSVEVDEVWHLHLTYTRDYWQRFCPEVLRTSLHHGPTAGGAQEAARYREQYAETLASYARWFGAPSARFWPDSAERFSAQPRYRRVDTRRRWVLQKPSMLDLGPPAALGLVLLLISPLAAALPANPLDWDGSSFLKLYIAALGGAVVVRSLIRQTLRGPDEPGNSLGMSHSEIAYLIGGPTRVMDTVVAELLTRQQANVNKATASLTLLVPIAELPAEIRPFVELLTGRGGLRHRAGRRHRALFEKIRQGLIRRRLVLPEGPLTPGRVTMHSLLPALALFGAAKVIVGVSRDKPVGFLLLLILLTMILFLVSLVRGVDRSRAGDIAIKKLQRDHGHVRRAPRSQDLPLAVALGIGAGVAANTVYADAYALRRPASGGGSSDGGSSCGGDGGGGCGGGGCGGCGGGS